ncbi:glycosyltransferase family 4 protein [Pikeienuella piscinae]|uniref:Glycosyltransferase family 4 protein n=1 Tax=Pikeienuella piscinae TaxID=2748098 RepID=A0A7L5C2S7_9RHOB|nr:glycosyltransferase [Pikeienuella piscinae]QIE56179.1 glycosyltransferase family 4 protein [Pikeienuella piscinae]
MHILMVLAGDARKASSRVRGYWIAEALENRGHEVTIRQTDRRTQYPTLLADIFRADVVVFQKKYGRYDILAARICRLLGKRFFFDIDDAPSRVLSSAAGRRAGKMMALSHGVLAGSEALVELSRRSQKAVHHFPSGIRLENYRPTQPADQRPVCLGWIGNGAHYADDLTNILAKPLSRLGARQPIRFRLVGACGVRRLYDVFGALEGVTIDFIDQIDWSSPDAVADAVEPFDIGLYPLSPGPFNEYKCAFKALEYMGCALPVVASGVGANAALVEDGETGFLCETAEDWEAALGRLSNDPELRARLGREGRRKAENDYSVSSLAAQLEAILLP